MTYPCLDQNRLQSQFCQEHATYTITDFSRIAKLHALLDSADKETPIALLYDDDADGVSSGVFLQLLLESYGFCNIVSTPKARDRATFSSDFLRNLEAMGVHIVICVDFEPISWRLIGEKKMEELPFDVVVIDHHFDQTDLYDRMGYLFLHPLNMTNSDAPSQYCCAKFVYDIVHSLIDISTHNWKAAVGMIGDMNIIQWPEYVSCVAKSHGVQITPSQKQSFFANPLGHFANVIGFAASVGSDELEPLFLAYVRASSVNELSEYFAKYANIQADYDSIITNWENVAEFDAEHDIYFVPINSKHMLASLASSVVSYINDAYSFCFYQYNHQKAYHISMRSQRAKVHLGNLLASVAGGFSQANGGGHIPAAGGFCQQKDFPKYIQAIKDKYDKFRIAE